MSSCSIVKAWLLKINFPFASFINGTRPDERWQRATHSQQHFASALVWITFTGMGNRKCQAFLRKPCCKGCVA